MSKSGASPRLGLPIAVQIIALLMAVLVVGQLATLAVVVVLPPPRPPVYRVEEIAAALKGERLTPRYAPPLMRSGSEAAPPQRRDPDPHAQGIQSDLARLLAVNQDQVRLRIEPPPFSFPFGDRGLRRRGRMDRPPSPDPVSGPPGRPPSQDPASGSLNRPEASPQPSATPLSPRAPPPPPPSPSPSPQSLSQIGGRPLVGADRPGRGRSWFSRRFGPFDRGGMVVGQLEAAYEASPGHWWVVRSQAEGFPTAWQRRMVLWFLACLMFLTPVGYLFARRLTAPLGRFAAAADRLGRDPRAPPMALRGPAEIGLAAAAFNEMQARLARYVEDRTAMIGAIAHDLRTPLARVQFKLQRGPADLAQDIRADLSQMEAMIAAVLAFVRDAAPTQERTALDLLSLLEVVADDATATGADVQVEPGPAAVVEGDASALQRLFVNLVDNAVKYGGCAVITLVLEEAEARVEIVDRGPGVPEEELERVFEPFHRLETSRSRETGGIGLGLSVARSIARAHGGDVTLAPEPGGLTAIVRLPRARNRS